MSNKFSYAIAVAVVAVALPLSAKGETMTIADYLSGKPEATKASDRAADENPFEDIELQLTDEALDAGIPSDASQQPDRRNDWQAHVAVVPPTPAARNHTPPVIVIVKGSGVGDFAYCIDCPPNATVGDTLRKATFPHPIDLSSTKIAVCRLGKHINDDLTVEAEEQIFRVEWDAKSGQPSEKTNYALLPNDRLIVTLPSTVVPAPPQPVPVTGGTFDAPIPQPMRAEGSPQTLRVAPHPYVPEAPHAVVYSALPAAAPSPFSTDDATRATRATAQMFGGVTPAINAEPVTDHPSTVKFDVVIVEDVGDSFAEFEQLKSRMPFMLTDTATIQGTLRILAKHNLIRRVSDPQLMVTAGQKATIVVGEERPGTDQPWQGIKAEMGARELGGGLAVDFSLARTEGIHTNKVQTALIVPHGQTVVMKTGSQLQQTSAEDDAMSDKVEHAVYVVLTPEIVK